MNKRGFTLVELLATIVVILMLGLIVTPRVLDVLKENRLKGYKEIEQRLEDAAGKYIVDKYVSSDTDSVEITKDELIDAKYIGEIYDLKDNSECEAYVIVSNLSKIATFNAVLTCSNYQSQLEMGSSSYVSYLYSNQTTREQNGLIKDNTADNNIRYAGSTVKNYVKFNDETWRIVGVFEVTKSNGTKEKLMKIVRDASLGSMSWDSSASTVNNGHGVNEWSEADLQTMLNTYYLGTGTACIYCNGGSQSTCTNDCSSIVTPINSTYTNMIEEVKWNTGAITWDSDRVIPVETAYEEERGTMTGKICTSGTYCNDTVERRVEWTGKVGLIYPSDYGYASTDTSCRANIHDTTNYPCKNSNWLHTGSYYWTLSPRAGSSYAGYGWFVVNSGYVGSLYAYTINGVRPAVYLKSSVKITDGDGSSGNPYILSL